MVNKLQIRTIQESDALKIAELSSELGYPVKGTLVGEQIKTIISDNKHWAFVATLNHEIVGYIHGFISVRLTSSPFLEIGGLIVDKKFRNRGIGRTLVDYLEQQVKEFSKIRVRCNIKRESAHKFYTSLQYSEKKEQKVFQKEI